MQESCINAGIGQHGVAAERRAMRVYATAEGTELERWSIVGLALAIEADEVVNQLKSLNITAQRIFMMAYACCMMWAIKRGLEEVLTADEVAAALRRMQQYASKYHWYQPGAFERIWEQTEMFMPIAISNAPDAPPPYPVAEMVTAANAAGYSLEPIVGAGMKFGIYMLYTMRQLTETSRVTAKEHAQRRQR